MWYNRHFILHTKQFVTKSEVAALDVQTRRLSHPNTSKIPIVAILL